MLASCLVKQFKISITFSFHKLIWKFLFIILVPILVITLSAFRACILRAEPIVDAFSQCWQIYGFSSVWVIMWCWRINLRVIYLSHCSQLKALCEPSCFVLVALLWPGSFHPQSIYWWIVVCNYMIAPFNVLIKCALSGLTSKWACHHNNCIKASYLHVSRKYDFVYLF